MTGRSPRAARLFLPCKGEDRWGLRRSGFQVAGGETGGPSCNANGRSTAFTARDPHPDPPPFRRRESRRSLRSEFCGSFSYELRRCAVQEPEQEAPLHEPLPKVLDRRPAAAARVSPWLKVTRTAPLGATRPETLSAMSP